MQVIDQINGSALFAQSAYSASIATKDSLGRDITTTYLTEHQDLSNYATTGDLNTVSSFLSGAIDYVSANAGDEFPASANDAITAYQTYSGTYLTNASAEVTYQPIGQYASASDITGFATKNELETTSGEIVNLIPSTAGLATEQLVQDTSATITGMIPSTAGLATETDLQIVSGGVDYISGVALTSIPTGTMNITGFEYNGDDLITAYNGSAFAGQGGTSIDTIPVAVISPLVTGFSGESAYLGIESTALNLSSYVPVSAIGVNPQGYVSGISGKDISAYYSRNSLTSNYSYTANRAYLDRDGHEITSYYQPKLTITGDAGTITSINGSAVGASIPEGWELVAGAGIEIVDDAENNQTIISVTAAGGNPEVESYVQSNSASIDDAVSTYQSSSGSYLTQETDWTNTITAASSYAYSEAVAQIPSPFDPTYMSGAIDYISGVAITALPSDLATTGDVNDLAQSISETYQPIGDYLTNADSANFYPMTGNPSGFLTTHQDISNKLDTTAFSDVSGTFLTEPNLEYNAVNEISAYNGSAIAQYGAEKQWLQHDDTLVHAANSAQYALGVNLSAVAQLLGIDETLLWSGSYTSRTFPTTESPYNFSKIEFVPQYSDSAKFGNVATVRINENTKYISLQYQVPSTMDCRMSVNMSVASSGFTVTEGARLRLAQYNASTTDTQTGIEPRITQIWGIGRKV